MASQIYAGPLFQQDLDPTYWLFRLLNLTILFQPPYTFILDGLLTSSCLLSVFFPYSSLYPKIFSIAFFIFYVLTNGFVGFHYAFYGVLFVPLPFLFSNSGRFAHFFFYIRFVFSFIYSTAGLWKVFRGNLTYIEQTRTILTNYNLTTLLNPDHSLRTQLLQWLVAHPVPAHSLWIIMTGLELVFLLGFITLRFDKWIGIAYLFALGGWYLFDVWNYENLFFLITLFPALQWVDRLSQKSPKIAS